MAELRKSQEGLSSHMYNVRWGWAEYFLKKDPRQAIRYIDECLKERPKNVRAIYYQSICERNLACVRNALEAALKAEELDGNNPHFSLNTCKCHYDLNQFECCKALLHNNARKYLSAINRDFQEHLIVVDENLKDSLGEGLGEFLDTNVNILDDVRQRLLKKSFVDRRPLWKVRRDNKECDVRSIYEDEEPFLPPLEECARARSYRIFTQIYLQRSWVDEQFLRELVKNEKWRYKNFIVTTPYLQSLVTGEYKIVNQFLRMLHTRSPMYNEYKRLFGDKKFFNLNQQQFFYQKQHETRRAMFLALRKIKQYRELGKIDVMAKYIEEFMGDFVVVKTTRIMPWKFEFINEIYNMYGLAICDNYVLKEDINLIPGEAPDKIRTLLQIVQKPKKYSGNFVFGQRSTYVPADSVDGGQEKYKKFIARLQKRLFFAKYPIEKSYLRYEMGRASFLEARYDEVKFYGKRAEEESMKCNSNLWLFLSLMLRVKSYLVTHKIEYCQNTLADALIIAEALKNDKLIEYVNCLISLNLENIQLKKNRLTSHDIVRKKSKSNSILSLESSRTTDSAEQ